MKDLLTAHFEHLKNWSTATPQQRKDRAIQLNNRLGFLTPDERNELVTLQAVRQSMNELPQQCGWVLSAQRLPEFGQHVEVSNDGLTVEDELLYLENRTCILAGIAGGHGYFDQGFATNGKNGTDYGLICDTPKYWRPVDLAQVRKEVVV